MSGLTLPASIGDALPHGVRFYRMASFAMVPTLRRGDVVAYVPGHRFDGDGLYMLDCGRESDVYRCQIEARTRAIHLWRDAPKHRRHRERVDHRRFAEIMRGRIIAMVQLCGGNLDDVLPPPGTEW